MPFPCCRKQGHAGMVSHWRPAYSDRWQSQTDLCSATETGMSLRDLCHFQATPGTVCPGVTMGTSSVLATYCTEICSQHLASVRLPGGWDWPMLFHAGNEKGMHSAPSIAWSSLSFLGTRSSLHFQDKCQSRHPWILPHLFSLTSVRLEDISHVIRLACPEPLEQNNQKTPLLSQ